MSIYSPLTLRRLGMEMNIPFWPSTTRMSWTTKASAMVIEANARTLPPPSSTWTRTLVISNGVTPLLPASSRRGLPVLPAPPGCRPPGPGGQGALYAPAPRDPGRRPSAARLRLWALLQEVFSRDLPFPSSQCAFLAFRARLSSRLFLRTHSPRRPPPPKLLQYEPYPGFPEGILRRSPPWAPGLKGGRG